jgi:hypothetical protein
VLERLFAPPADGGYADLGELQKDLHDTHAHPPEVTPGLRAAQLGLQAAALGVGLVVMYAAAGLAPVFLYAGAVGRAREADAALAAAREAPPRDPRAVDRLVRSRDAAAAEAEGRRAALLLPYRWLVEGVDEVTRDDPDPVPTPGQVREAVRRADGREPVWEWAGFELWVAVAGVPLLWVVGAGVLRGGVSMRLAGVAVVRADGRRASRRRCAARAALVWLPVAALLAGSVWVQVAHYRHPYPAAALWLLAAALLPVYVVVALKDPARPPQDRLMGTYLVPE